MQTFIRHLIFFLLLVFSSCSFSKMDALPGGSKLIRFERSDKLSDVLDKAKDAEKVVFLDVYTDWCLPCKLMEEEVYSDKATADFMNKNFINHKVNAERNEGPDLSLIYSIDAYPTLLFLNYKGKVIKRHVGGISLEKFNEMLDEVLKMPKDWM